MDKELQKALQRAYEVPEPKEKEQFLRNLEFPKMDKKDFLIGQIGYIRKSVWVFSVLIFINVLYLISSFAEAALKEETSLWIISSVLPFLGLFSVTELSRSERYRMSELEAGCRFGLSQVLIARMLILGVWNGIILGAVILLLGNHLAEGIVITALYLLAPYLFVCGASLFLLNHIRNRNGASVCAAVTVGINLLNLVMKKSVMAAGDRNSVLIMSFLLLTGFCMVGTQIRKMLKRVEEEQWNFV